MNNPNQGNLFDQPKPDKKPADSARLQLTTEASERRRQDREAQERRSAETTQRREEQIARAAEQGVDLRTHQEIRKASAERGITNARAELERAVAQPDVNN